MNGLPVDERRAAQDARHARIITQPAGEPQSERWGVRLRAARFASHAVCVRQTADHVWLVTFMDYEPLALREAPD